MRNEEWTVGMAGFLAGIVAAMLIGAFFISDQANNSNNNPNARYMRMMNAAPGSSINNMPSSGGTTSQSNSGTPVFFQ